MAVGGQGGQPETQDQLAARIAEAALAAAEKIKNDPKRFGVYKDDPYGFFADVWGMEKWSEAEPDKPGLTPDQCTVIDAVIAGETNIAIRSGHSLGKAMPHSLIVDTPSGKRAWGSLDVGDRLWGSDGQPTTIVALHPQGVRSLARVRFSDGTETRCDWDHLWSVKSRNDRRTNAQWRTLTTRELLDRGVRRHNGKNEANNWEVPVLTAPMAYPEVDLPCDPYVMGAWLGDGCRNTAYVTTGETDIPHWLEQLSGSWKVATQNCIMVPGLRNVLRETGVYGSYSYEKEVPAEFMRGSPAQRLALLQGLMDSDGTVSKTGTCTFTTTSPGLFKQVQWLVRSLGGLASAGSNKWPWYRDASGERKEGREAFNVSISLPVCPFRLERKAERWVPPRRGLRRWIEAIEPDGEEEASCVTVDAEDHLYVANDGIVTHNSFLLGLVLLWWLYARQGKVVTTASTWGQVERILWVGVAQLYNSARVALPGQLMQTELRVEPGWTAIGISTDNPTAFQGFHDPNLLVLVDEAPGVQHNIHDAIGSLATGEKNVVIKVGNPTESSGPFYEHFRKGNWCRIHMSPHRHPNVILGREVIPGAVTRKWIEDKKLEWGEGSPIYASRVLGEFPEAGVRSVIPLPWVDRAMSPTFYEKQREALDGGEPVIMACDVARFGDDRTTVAFRKGNVVLGVEVMPTQDLMGLVGDLVRMREEMGAAEIVVDVVGLGSGVVDRLQELGEPVLAFHSGQRPSDKSIYLNRRAELWFKIRRKLELEQLALPDDDGLRADLTAPLWQTHSSGKIKLESKDDLKRRGGKSTDVADAVLMTFAVDLGIEEEPLEVEVNRDMLAVVGFDEQGDTGPMSQYGSWI